MWEQFATVATDLLERLQSCMSLNPSPIQSSDDDDDELAPRSVDEKSDSWGGKYKKWIKE